MKVNNCIKTLDELQQKLEDVGEKMSIVVGGQEGGAEIIDLIKDDWEYISTVMDCRDELVDLKILLQEHNSSKANIPSPTSAGSNLDKIVHFTTQLQQLIGKKQAGAISPKTDLSSTQISEQQSLEVDSRLGKYISSCGGPTIKKDQNLDGGSRLGRDLRLGSNLKPGGDQGLGGGPRPGNNLSLGRVSAHQVDLNLGGGPRLGRKHRLEKDKSKMRPKDRQRSKPKKRQMVLN